MSEQRRYYSARQGGVEVLRLDLDKTKSFFEGVYGQLKRGCYLQEAFGYHCVDAGDVPGRLGSDKKVTDEVHLVTGKNLWPVERRLQDYSKDDLFDMMEFMFDHVSKPVPDTGRLHGWDNCGWHYDFLTARFNKVAGQEHYKALINRFLARYEQGFVLSNAGEICMVEGDGLEDLVQTAPGDLERRSRTTYDAAIRRWRLSRGEISEMHAAVVELAGILERLRPSAKLKLLRQDEKDLFELANKFGIRHSDESQKVEYEEGIWLPWMFHYYVSTIQALTKLSARLQN